MIRERRPDVGPLTALRAAGLCQLVAATMRASVHQDLVHRPLALVALSFAACMPYAVPPATGAVGVATSGTRGARAGLHAELGLSPAQLFPSLLQRSWESARMARAPSASTSRPAIAGATTIERGAPVPVSRCVCRPVPASCAVSADCYTPSEPGRRGSRSSAVSRPVTRERGCCGLGTRGARGGHRAAARSRRRRRPRTTATRARSQGDRRRCHVSPQAFTIAMLCCTICGTPARAHARTQFGVPFRRSSSFA